MEKEQSKYPQKLKVQKKDGIKLDKKDKKILLVLESDSSTPVSTIAKRIELKTETVRYKIKRLKKLGIIKKFTILIDTDKLGYQRYLVLWKIRNHIPKITKQFVACLNTENPVVKIVRSDCYGVDFMTEILAKNNEAFKKILDNIIDSFHGNVYEFLSINIFEEIKHSGISREFLK